MAMLSPDNTKKPHPRKGSKAGMVPGNEGRLAYLNQPFVPDDLHRQFVLKMAGFKSVTVEEIASLIINPHTKKPIDVSTLYRHFRHEIETGRQSLKSTIGEKYYDRLQAGEWPAIQWGLKHVMGYRDEAPALNVGVNGDVDELRITFVLPDGDEQ